MALDYGTLLSPSPLKTGICTFRKPTLREIAENGYDNLYLFEYLMQLTPDKYYTDIAKEENKGESLFQIIVRDDTLREGFLGMFGFFIKERVLFREGVFVVLKDEADEEGNLTENDIRGIIFEKNFSECIIILQQICDIYDNTKEEKPRFKNDLARQLYERMQKAAAQTKAKSDKNLTIPNIISAVSNNHPSITPVTVWDMTLFQLIDSFERLRMRQIYDIDSHRVAVWGDEKKTFDAALWYKNYFDK